MLTCVNLNSKELRDLAKEMNIHPKSLEVCIHLFLNSQYAKEQFEEIGELPFPSKEYIKEYFFGGNTATGIIALRDWVDTYGATNGELTELQYQKALTTLPESMVHKYMNLKGEIVRRVAMPAIRNNSELVYFLNRLGIIDSKGKILISDIKSILNKLNIDSNSFYINLNNEIKFIPQESRVTKESTILMYQKPADEFINNQIDRLKAINKTLKELRTYNNINETLQEKQVALFIIDGILELAHLDWYNIRNLTPYLIYTILLNAQEDNTASLYNEYCSQEIDSRLNDYLEDYLSDLNIPVKKVSRLWMASKNGGNIVNAMYDVINKVIYISNNPNDLNSITFPEEFAHAVIELMGASALFKWVGDKLALGEEGKAHNKEAYEYTKDYITLYNQIQSLSIYQLVYDRYKNIYKNKDGSPNIDLIKKEAIGQALAIAIKLNWLNKHDELENSFWNTLKEMFFKFIKLFQKKKPIEITTLLNDIANDVLNKNYDRIRRVDTSNYKLLDFATTIKELNKKDNGKALKMMKALSNMGIIISGSLSYRYFGKVYRKGYDSLHDIDVVITKSVHNLDLPKLMKKGSEQGEVGLMQVLWETPIMLKIIREISSSGAGQIVLGSFYIGDSGYTASAAFSEDIDICHKFLSIPGSYADRLKKMTKEEVDKLYLFDFFFKENDNYKYIVEPETNLKLNNWQESFRAKLNMARPKDIMDYVNFELYKQFKNMIEPEDSRLFMYQVPTYNVGLQNAIDKITDYCVNHTLLSYDDFFLLTGSAGTGKTFIINLIVENVAAKTGSVPKIAVTAVANAAVENLHTKINPNYFAKKGSVAKILGRKMEDGGTRTTKSTKFPTSSPAYGADILFIDECSMITDKDLKELYEFRKNYNKNLTLIFLGDDGLLGPVTTTSILYLLENGFERPKGESRSAVFLTAKENKHAHLSELVRQGKDSPIIEASRVYYDTARTEKTDIERPDIRDVKPGVSNDGAILKVSKDKALKEAMALYDEARETKNPNLVKICTYTNAAANSANKKVYKHFHPEENLKMTPYHVGDHMVMFNSWVIDPDSGFLINNGTLHVIKAVSEPREATELKAQLKEFFEILGEDNPEIPDYHFLDVTIDIPNGEGTMEVTFPTLCAEERGFSSMGWGIDKLPNTALRQYMSSHNGLIPMDAYLRLLRYGQGPKNRSLLARAKNTNRETYELANTILNSISLMYADTQLGYAITTHKAQGLTYLVAIVDCADINKRAIQGNHADTEEAKADAIKEYSRMMYTAITRASNITMLIMGDSWASDKAVNDVLGINNNIKTHRGLEVREDLHIAPTPDTISTSNTTNTNNTRVVKSELPKLDDSRSWEEIQEDWDKMFEWHEDHVLLIDNEDEHYYIYYPDGISNPNTSIKIEDSLTSLTTPWAKRSKTDPMWHWGEVSKRLGITLDDIIRDALDGLGLGDKVTCITNNKYPNVTLNDLRLIQAHLNIFKLYLDKKYGNTRYKIRTSTLPLVGKVKIGDSYRSIGGTLDIIIYDEDGGYEIYDIKTSRQDINTKKDSTLTHYGSLLNGYRVMLEKQHPALKGKCKGLNLFQWNLYYDIPKDCKATIKTINGRFYTETGTTVYTYQGLLIYANGKKIEFSYGAKNKHPKDPNTPGGKVLTAPHLFYNEDGTPSIEKSVIENIQLDTPKRSFFTKENDKVVEKSVYMAIEPIDTKSVDKTEKSEKTQSPKIDKEELPVINKTIEHNGKTINISSLPYTKDFPNKNKDTACVFTENAQCARVVLELKGEDVSTLLKVHEYDTPTLSVKDYANSAHHNTAGIRTDNSGNVQPNSFGIIVKKALQSAQTVWLLKEGQFQDTGEDFATFTLYNEFVFRTIELSGLNKIHFPASFAMGRSALPLSFTLWLKRLLKERFGIDSIVAKNPNKGYDGYGLKLIYTDEEFENEKEILNSAIKDPQLLDSETGINILAGTGESSININGTIVGQWTNPNTSTSEHRIQKTFTPISIAEIVDKDGNVDWEAFEKVQKEFFDSEADNKFTKGRKDLTTRKEHHDEYTADDMKELSDAMHYPETAYEHGTEEYNKAKAITEKVLKKYGVESLPLDLYDELDDLVYDKGYNGTMTQEEIDRVSQILNENKYLNSDHITEKVSLDHIKNVVKSAQTRPLPEGVNRRDLVIGALLHDIGKPYHNEDHGYDSSEVALKMFTSINPIVLIAILHHMINQNVTITKAKNIIGDYLALANRDTADVLKFIQLLLAVKECDIYSARTDNDYDAYYEDTISNGWTKESLIIYNIFQLAYNSIKEDNQKDFEKRERERIDLELRVRNYTTVTIDPYKYYSKELIALRLMRENLNKSNLVTPRELKSLAKGAIFLISDMITKLNSGETNGKEEYFKYLIGGGILFENISWTSMSRAEIMQTIGLHNIYHIIKEKYYNPLTRPTTEEEANRIGVPSKKGWKMSQLMKMNLIRLNFMAFIEQGYPTLLELEEISMNVLDNMVQRHSAEDEAFEIEDIDTVFETYGSALESWQIGFRLVSAHASLSALLKRELGALLLYEFERDSQGNIIYDNDRPRIKPIKGDLGFNERVNSSEAVSSILVWTLGARDINDMINRLEEHLTDAPWMLPLLDKLKQENNQAEIFKSLFWTNFKKYFSPYIVLYLKKTKRQTPNGEVEVSTLTNKVINLNELADSLVSDFKARWQQRTNGVELGGLTLYTSEGKVHAGNLSALEANYKRLAELKADEALPSDINKVLSEIYASFDILIDPETAKKISNKEDIKAIKDSLYYIIGGLKGALHRKQDDYDLTDLPGTKGTLRKLFAVVANKDVLSMESVSYEDGKLQYSYVVPSFLSNLTEKLQGNTGDMSYEEFIENEYGQYEWFKKDGQWLCEWARQAAMDEDFKKNFRHSVVLTSATRRGEAVNYRDKSPVLYAKAMLLNYFYASGNKNDMYAWYRVPMMSNKPSEEYLRGRKYIGDDYKDEITDLIVNGILKAEVDRIKLVRRRNSDSNVVKIKNFDKRGTKFLFLDYLEDFREAYAAYEDGDVSLTTLERLYDEALNSLEEAERLNGSDESLINTLLNNLDTIENAYIGKIIEEKLNENPLVSELKWEDLMTKAVNKGMDTRFKDYINTLTEEGVLELDDKGNYLLLLDIAAFRSGDVIGKLENFFWNDAFAAINIFQLTITDLAYYKDTEDVQKRMAQIHAPGLRGNYLAKWYDPTVGEMRPIADKHERTIYIADFEDIVSDAIESIRLVFKNKADKLRRNYPGTSMASDFEKSAEALLESFKNINVTDAQGYSSITSYRKKAIMFGKWNEELEDTYLRIRSGNYTERDLNMSLLPLKPFVYSHTTKDYKGTKMKVGMLNKNSEYLLLMMDAILLGEANKQSVDGKQANLSKLSAIYQVMEESHYDALGNYKTDGIDTVQFNSTVKAGEMAVININAARTTQEAKLILERAVYMNGNRGDIYNLDTVHVLNWEDYAMLSEVPAHLEGNSIFGSLTRILGISDMMENINGEEQYIYMNTPKGRQRVSLKKAKLEYMDAIQLNIAQDLLTLSDKFKLYLDIKVKNGELIITNKTETKDGLTQAVIPSIEERQIALSNLLIEEIKSDSRYGYDMLLSVSTDLQGHFTLPLSDLTMTGKILQLLHSIIKSRINKLLMPGGPVVQVTNYGTSKELDIVWQDELGNTLETLRLFYERVTKDLPNALAYSEWVLLARYEKKSNYSDEKQLYLELYKPIADRFQREIGSKLKAVKYFECYAPSTVFKDFADANGVIDINKVPDWMLECIGYRI